MFVRNILKAPGSNYSPDINHRQRLLIISIVYSDYALNISFQILSNLPFTKPSSIMQYILRYWQFFQTRIKKKRDTSIKAVPSAVLWDECGLLTTEGTSHNLKLLISVWQLLITIYIGLLLWLHDAEIQLSDTEIIAFKVQRICVSVSGITTRGAKMLDFGIGTISCVLSGFAFPINYDVLYKH